MGNPEYPATHTTNDLLFDLDPGRLRTALNYEIVAQSAEEVQDIQNAPAISMGQYLIESEQVKLLTTISIHLQVPEWSKADAGCGVLIHAWGIVKKRPTNTTLHRAHPYPSSNAGRGSSSPRHESDARLRNHGSATGAVRCTRQGVVNEPMPIECQRRPSITSYAAEQGDL